MRNFKRILSLVLTIAMLASCLVTVAFAAETTKGKFSDVASDSGYATAVEALSLMGVINGYEDGSFRPDQNVTRAEFTAMLMRTLNYGSLGSSSAAELPFTDVSDSDSDINWSIPNINTAYGMGIINGYEDCTFRPTNNVAYEEAIKMIVCTLGYTDIDVDLTPWYSNYIAQANRLGITENASTLGQAENPASRACIAQMLYDSLTVNICENEKVTTKTILSDYLGYIKNTGIISSNGVTGLTQPDADLNANEIQIYAKEESTGSYETYTYKTTDDSLKNYLGHEVEFYYKDNGGTRTLAFAVLNPYNELTLNPEDITVSSSSSTQLRYYKSADASSTSSVALDAENVVIYNGKLYGSSARTSRFDTDMIPLVGTVTLLDSDTDGKYDVINIKDYEIYYVSSKLSTDYSITDDVTRTADKKLILDVEDDSIKTTITDVTGKEIAFSSIAQGSIICLAKSNPDNGGEVVQAAVVVNNSVSGTVSSSKSGESITINGKVYAYSPAAPWMSGNSSAQAEPSLEDSGTYCLDINGKIVAYKKNATTENVYYGYLMGIAKSSSSFSEEMSVRLLNQNGSQILATINDDTRVDGVSFSSVADVQSALEDAAALQNNDPDAENVTVHQLVKYVTRTSGGTTYLSKIYTGAPTSSGVSSVTSDALPFYSKVDGADTMTCSTNGTLTGNGTTINASSAIVFNVPSNRSATNDYSKSTGSSAFKKGIEYNVEVFDLTTTGKAYAIVCYGADASTEVDDYSPVSVITEDVVTQTNSTAGKNMSYVEGYTVSSSSSSTLNAWVSDESTWDPSFGDIYRAGTDRDGYDLIQGKNILYTVSGGNDFGKTYSGGNDIYDATFAYILGSVVARDDQSISFIPQYLGEGDTVEDITGQSINFDFTKFSSAKVLRYNYDKNNRLQSIDDVSSSYQDNLMSLATYNDGLSNPTKVLIYLSEGNIELLCILGENIAE
ncbi:MAG: S-layer homology domain-containing protein [Clostridia bacterium]|nr:S-layer homology domain-containing protein [Clostridia bacterium]